MAVEGPYDELAAYYDLIYHWKNYAGEAEKIHKIIRKYKQSPGHDLLEVACGTGNYIQHLQGEYAITGLDLSPAMLRRAQDRYPHLQFIRGDMTDFNLNRIFDVILCLFSSIAYVKTYANVKKTFQCFAKHLVSGGVAIVEPFILSDAFQVGVPFADHVERPDIKISRMNVSRRQGNLAILDFHFLVGTNKGVRHFTAKHELGLFDPHEVVKIIGQAGLRGHFVRDGLSPNRGLYLAIKP